MSTRIASLNLTSRAFRDGDKLPVKYSCDGAGISPPLAWGNPPDGTAAFVLVLDDPDAPSGSYTHWILADLPPETRELPENAGTGELGTGVFKGVNSAGNTGYDPPCPPPGRPHHYRFTVYAVNERIGLGRGARRRDIDAAVRGRVLAQGQLTGIYGRY